MQNPSFAWILIGIGVCSPSYLRLPILWGRLTTGLRLEKVARGRPWSFDRGCGDIFQTPPRGASIAHPSRTAQPIPSCPSWQSSAEIDTTDRAEVAMSTSTADDWRRRTS